MRFTAKIDRNYTEKEFIERVKADCKQFSSEFDAEDLLERFTAEMEEKGNEIELGVKFGASNFAVIECSVRGFDGGWAFGNVTHFCVEMMVIGYSTLGREITKYRFYCDMNGNTTELYTDRGDRMYRVERFVNMTIVR